MAGSSKGVILSIKMGREWEKPRLSLWTPGLGQDLNPVPPEYKVKLVPTWEPLSVIYSIEEFVYVGLNLIPFMSHDAHLHSQVQREAKHFASSMALGFLGTPNKKRLCSQWNLTHRTEQEIKCNCEAGKLTRFFVRFTTFEIQIQGERARQTDRQTDRKVRISIFERL